LYPLREEVQAAKPLPYGHKHNMRPTSSHVVGNALQHLLTTTTYEQGWKRPSRHQVRAFGMRRSRSIGEAKTHLQHIGITAAIDVARLIDWLDGTGPAPTRSSAFQRLLNAA
jgi:hypothetical protein